MASYPAVTNQFTTINSRIMRRLYFTIIFGHTFPHQLQLTPLKRSVGDFIDHLVYVLGSPQLPEQYITTDVLYPISDNPVHIHYASKQVCQGWVCRTLTPSELGLLYKFDMNLQFSNIKGMVPRSMLTLLLSTLELQQDESKTKEILQPMAIPSVHQKLDYT